MNFIQIIMEIHSRLLERVSQPKSNDQQFKRTKLLTLGVLLIIYCGLVLWPHQVISEEQCLYDGAHELTKGANQKLWNDGQYRFRMMVSGQIFIDIALVGLMIIFVAEFKNFSALAWMLGFYLTRASLLNTFKMPYPEGIYWENQGVFSVGVPYGITRDFFYSGHTGFMVYSVRVWAATRFKPMKFIMVVGLLQVIWLVTVTRVHYNIDIVAGWIFAQWFSYLVMANIKIIDLLISKVVQGFVIDTKADSKFFCVRLKRKKEAQTGIIEGSYS